MAADEQKGTLLGLLDMSAAFDCFDRLDPVVSQWTDTAGRVRR